MAIARQKSACPPQDAKITADLSPDDSGEPVPGEGPTDVSGDTWLGFGLNWLDDSTVVRHFPGFLSWIPS